MKSVTLACRLFLDKQREKAITSAQTLIENVIFHVPVNEKRYSGLSRVIPRHQNSSF